jgi:CubicO group peptidase (beta-lactamase class C family)
MSGAIRPISFAAKLRLQSPAKAGLSSEKLARVDDFMRTQIANGRMVGSVILVARNGHAAHVRAYGEMDREAKTPMRPDAIFRFRSMTKAITTAAALRLTEAGKLGLDEPVSKYVSSFGRVQVATSLGLRPPVRPMTVRDLMRHTSGLTYGNSGPGAHRNAFASAKPLQANSLEQFCERLSQVPLAFDPGTTWAYSVSTDVLGRVIEVVSGESLDVHLSKSMLNPLGMEDTGFTVLPNKLGRLAAVYQRTTTGLRKAEYSSFPFLSGGGGLFGTGPDYLQFLLMLQNDGLHERRRILRPQSVALMTSDRLPAGAEPISFPGPGGTVMQGTGFGLGFYVRKQITPAWDPDAHAGEYGWAGSANTFYWVSPADKLIVITLQQSIPFQWDFGAKKLIYDSLSQ